MTMTAAVRRNLSEDLFKASFEQHVPNYALLTSTEYNVIGAVFAFVALFSFLSNGCVLLVFTTNKSLHSATNLFIISLCVSDLLMSLCSSVSCAASFQKGWVFGNTICTIEGFSVFFLGLTSMYLLAAISVDRYIVIVKPIMGAKITKRVALVVILMCWGLGFLWAGFPLVGWNHYAKEGVGISCSVVWSEGDLLHFSYIVSIFIFCLVIPLCLMVFSYINIYLTIRSIARNSVWSANSRMARKNQRLERKMMKTTIILVLVYVGSWLPYTVVSFMAAFGPPRVISPLMATLPALVAKCSGLWNPLVYVVTNAQYRKAFSEVFRCVKADNRESGGYRTSSRYNNSPAETTTLEDEKFRVIPGNIMRPISPNDSAEEASVSCTLPNEERGTTVIELTELCHKTKDRS